MQCAGFAYLCYYKCHGYLRSSRIGTRYVVGNEGIRAGDVIRMSGHTAFVWNVNGDQLSILEANYGALCRIDHSRTVRASEVLHYWTPKAYVLHYNANGGQGSPNAKIVPIDTPYTLGDGALWRPGYQFAGWTVSRLTSSESLYEKNGTRAYFADPVQAQQEGWKLAVVASWESLTPSDFGQPLAQSGDDIELRAVWKEKHGRSRSIRASDREPWSRFWFR
ncbi:CHAP domain-containing protein [Allobaculum sp. Allo2]|uniref:CHAP domain-containing protein n=1 Tax=Allobaculum sp. Allo2 TaxID=2853432 RepID=UPI001F62627B|nr:CHAP domain-containing protein [Allobaculum sp. Allo2]UNT92846.1 CHAP domain-containing protein [Allobaculum sp. Allo2]